MAIRRQTICDRRNTCNGPPEACDARIPVCKQILCWPAVLPRTIIGASIAFSLARLPSAIMGRYWCGVESTEAFDWYVGKFDRLSVRLALRLSSCARTAPPTGKPNARPSRLLRESKSVIMVPCGLSLYHCPFIRSHHDTTGIHRQVAGRYAFGTVSVPAAFP